MYLSIYFLVTLVQLHASDTLAALPHVKCTRTYHKLGCYKKVSSSGNPWQLLITDRSDSPDGYLLDWRKWEESIHSLACRCAEVARRQNFTVFGLQNYAECWSGPNAEKSFNRNGGSDRCLMILKLPPDCNMNDPRECMGMDNVNFMYRLDVDHCRKHPCKNGATCVAAKPFGYKCDCTQGFTGSHCETDVNECNRMPCKNGGSCFNKPGSFECFCRKGYQGKLCEKDVNECVMTRCQNQGTCVNTVGSFKCQCKPGFTGTFCENESVCDKKGIYDLGLIIDGSGSLGNKFSTTIFLVGLINQFRVSKDEVRFGIIAYGSKPEVVCQFSDRICHHQAMDVKIMVMKMEFPDGERRTDKALMKAGKELYSSSGGHRTGVPSVLVVITDGNTVPGSQPYSDVLQPLKDNSVNIIAVGVGNKVTTKELTKIAMNRPERVIQRPTIDDPSLIEDLRNMIEDIC
ncbi:unnamed protein product [Porites lobata]|uniref:Uncharacterized protein n=1 Tax=Porites lobata TaxID=104759 RepID=A0ABN8R6Z2_9CNID|nr:unnamed protein product [Porites lobata]